MATARSGPIPFAGRARFRRGVLRIEGRARYPNDFSTASLEPIEDAALTPPAHQAFALAFHRDKEPYCDADLVGPVVYESWSRHAARIRTVRVYVTPELFEDITVERRQDESRLTPPTKSPGAEHG